MSLSARAFVRSLGAGSAGALSVGWGIGRRRPALAWSLNPAPGEAATQAAQQEVIRISGNENARGPGPAAIEAMEEVLHGNVGRYGFSAPADLAEAIARRVGHGLTPGERDHLDRLWRPAGRRDSRLRLTEPAARQRHAVVPQHEPDRTDTGRRNSPGPGPSRPEAGSGRDGPGGQRGGDGLPVQPEQPDGDGTFAGGRRGVHRTRQVELTRHGNSGR